MARRARGAGACTRSRAAPLAERPQEILLELRRKPVVLGAEPADGRDRLSHLVEVGDARVAEAQVLLEALAVSRREAAFEVLGDEFDDLGAGELACQSHECR